MLDVSVNLHFFLFLQSNNGFGPEGAGKLAVALAKLSSITTLDLVSLYGVQLALLQLGYV